MVIVGAGEAGARAAMALREAGWDGAVTLFGAEPTAPYERPPLSKAAMLSDAEPKPVEIVSATGLADAGVAFLPGCDVVGIDRAARRVRCADGTALSYHRLLLATGARPRRLSLPGAEHALLLRRLADATAICARLRHGAHVVIIGAGFIGLELAASAIGRGCRVTVLEAGLRVLGRGVPLDIADVVAARHCAAGVTLRLGVQIATLEADVVRLRDGTAIACDVVVAGIGAAPDTDLAEAGDLAIDNGIRVDAHLRTEDEAIFAAGDCCSYPSALYGGRRLRLEAWRNAQTQGAHAARAMLGETAPFDEVPWFWSDQYDQALQVAGLPDAGSTAIRRDGDGVVFVFHLDQAGRLVAASGVGKPALAKDIKLAERLIAQRATPDPAALADPTVRLRSLLAH